MFPRQWHSAQSQLGLLSCFLDFEYSLRHSNFALAESILFENFYLDSSFVYRHFKRLRFIQRFVSSKANHLTYSFVDFWPDHDPLNSQLLDFVKHSAPHLKFSHASDYRHADIVFCSCYGNTDLNSLSPHSTRILFLGENVRPQYYFYDYSLSFDIDSYCLRNIYFPLWLFEVDWFNRITYPDRNPFPVTRFTSPLLYDPGARKDSVLYVGNNHEPYRTSFMNTLSSCGIPIEKFGSHSRPVSNKDHLLSTFKATIAFENSFSSGYITEKSIHGLLSCTPTLYWGGDIAPFSPFLDHPLLLHCSPLDHIHKTLGALQAFFALPKSVFPPILTTSFSESFFASATRQIRDIFSIYDPN